MELNPRSHYQAEWCMAQGAERRSAAVAHQLNVSELSA